VAEDAGYDAVDSLVGLAAVLRAMGVDASTDRAVAAVSALHELDPVRKADVYWAGRLTLCGTPDDLVRYDVAFDAYFGDRPGAVVRRQRLTTTQLQLVAEPGPGADGSGRGRRGLADGGGSQHGRAAAPPRRDHPGRRRAGAAAPLLAALQLPGSGAPPGGCGRRSGAGWTGAAPCGPGCRRAVSRRRCGTGRRPAGRAGSSCSST
jgi:hypothetical protein